MIYLKLYEDFEEEEKSYMGLSQDQEEDLREVFYELITKYNMDYKSAMEYFKPGSQTLANFFHDLESETTWFDYTQVDLVFEDISIYLMELEIDEEELEDEDESDEDPNDSESYNNG
jgi:hypothetical protein